MGMISRDEWEGDLAVQPEYQELWSFVTRTHEYVRPGLYLGSPFGLETPARPVLEPLRAIEIKPRVKCTHKPGVGDGRRLTCSCSPQVFPPARLPSDWLA